jgi:integrase/recombinase XerD
MTPLPTTKALTRAEANAVLAACEPTCISKLQKRVMLETMIRVGLRTCELCALKSAEIEWPCEENGQNCFLHLTRTKGNRPRSIPVPDALYSWLERWAAASAGWKSARMGRETPYFFHPLNYASDKPFCTRAIRAALVPICERATGRHVTLHMLRHTFGTNAVESGVPLPGVQRMLGHAKVETTMIYVGVRQEALAAMVRGLT